MREPCGLLRFLDDGRIEIDSNTVERSMRPVALNRKNALFAGSDEGAENWAMLASLIETCKLHGINPHAYSYCVIELDKHQWFSAARCSMDIAPGCWRGQRSDVGASSRSSSRHVVRGGRAAPRGRRFWETPSVANLSAASSAAEGESLARSAIRKA